MSQCYQFRTQTTLEHGYSVAQTYHQLFSNNADFYSKWQKHLPAWYPQYWQYFVQKQLPLAIVEIYLIYHDCGKFKVQTKDKEGISHFPDHAKISKELWEDLFGASVVSELISRDMDMHLTTPSRIMQYDKPEIVPTLLLCALAELLSNCEMFGGPDSVSFKIKLKAISRLGNTFFKCTST